MENKNLIITVCASMLALLPVAASCSTSQTESPKQVQWSFNGMFGKYDKPAAQRGYQVYKQVCAACHSISGITYGNLKEIGFSEAEVKAIAAEYKVMDGPNDAGEMFERPARPSDKMVGPFANEKAARASNNGAYPPDLTLMAKARHDGPNYIYSLLTGYSEVPAGFHLNEGMNYNPYFPGAQIAMPAPIGEGAVSYQDGTVATIDQMSRDVTTFLQWAAEPELEARNLMGLKVLGFLLITTAFMYVAMKRVWCGVKKK